MGEPNLVSSGAGPTAIWAAVIAEALLREEHLGHRPPRLREPGLATWRQFRGRMGAKDLLELLREDAAVTQPLAFSPPSAVELMPFARLDGGALDGWLEQIGARPSGENGDDYLTAQAKRLDLPTRMAKADLHKMKPHHKALELPGTGGQLAHHVVTTQEGIYFQDVFTVACRDWRDFTLATLVAVELGLAGQPPVVIDPELSRMRSRGEQFDYVLGVAQEKGGLYEEADLKRFFPRAKVVVV